MRLRYSHRDISSIQEISWFYLLRTITHLDVSNNNLVTLEGLHRFPHLTFLDCRKNRLITLQGIEHCPNLKYLYCDENQLTSLEELKGCPNLARVYCSGNPSLTSLKGLESCLNLEFIDYLGETLPLLRFRQGIHLIQRIITPIIDKRIRKFQRMWQEYYYFPSVRYKQEWINRLCYLDM